MSKWSNSNKKEICNCKSIRQPENSEVQRFIHGGVEKKINRNAWNQWEKLGIGEWD